MATRELLHALTAAIIAASVTSSCCTKKECAESANVFNEIHVAFSGLSQLQLDSLNHSFRWSGFTLTRDSVYLNEFNQQTGQMISSSILSAPDTGIGSGYVTPQLAFYINQRFFTISRHGVADTIGNISYTSNPMEYNCNNCPGEHDYKNTITNFSYTYQGKTYTSADTVYIPF
jgi:hypothetical protein